MGGKLFEPTTPGKRCRRVLLAANNTPLINVAARSSKWQDIEIDFVVDTGAAVSILPVDIADNLSIEETPTRLTNADGTPIHVIGETTVEFAIGNFNRSFVWKFVVAHTQQALLGIDFLKYYRLFVDCANNRIIDAETKRSTGTPRFEAINTIILEKPIGPAGPLLEKFPNLTKPRNPLTDKAPKIMVQHAIDTGTHLPRYSRPRRLNEEAENDVREDFNKLLKEGIIRPSKSPWASPLHRVSKPGTNKKRNTGDYRNVNTITTPDRYPVPSLHTVTSKLHGKSVFSKIDLLQAYYQIDMKPEDIPKTAINTPCGLFEFIKMPFGLKNAGSTFQRYMDTLFRETPNIFVYFDDILIFSEDEESHAKDVEEVLRILDENNLKISVEKCSFFKDKIDFLGYEISRKGMKPTEEKRKYILEFPEPTDAKSLRRFLGLVNFYRRLVKDFTQKVLPLSELMRLNQKAKHLQLTENEKRSFSLIKEELAMLASLTHPSNELTQYQLVTDSSKHAVGAVLHQMIEGEAVPIGFFSKKLSIAEQKYSAFDRELLAAYRAVLHFRPFIECRTVTMFTDHKPLVSAFKSQNPAKSDRQQRHLTIIAEYIGDLQHIKGDQNIVADCLSRPVPINAIAVDTCDLQGLARLQVGDEETEHWKKEKQLKAFKMSNEATLWCDVSTPIPRPFVPKEARRAIFEEWHTPSHPGATSTVNLIKTRYYWLKIKAEICEWCKTCEACQRAKITRHTRSEVSDFKLSGDRFEIVHIDIVGPLPIAYEYNDSYSSKFRYLLTCIDRATRWTEAIPIADVAASTVAVAFMEIWITRFGVPSYVVTDRGSQFEAELFSELSRLTGFHRIRTTAYHPQSNGMIERAHRTIKTALKTKDESWIRALPMVLLGIRMTPNESGYAPFTAVTGSYINIPRIITSKEEQPNGELDDNTIKNIIRIMKNINFHEMSQGIHHGKPKSYVPKELQNCAYVWVRIDRVRKPLEAPYSGPFKVIKRGNKIFTIIGAANKEQNVSIDRLKPAQIATKPPQNTTLNNNTQQETQTIQNNLSEPIGSDAGAKRNENVLAQQTRSGRKVRFNRDKDMVFLY